MNTWKDYEGAAEELDSGMRDNFELSGPLVDIAKYAQKQLTMVFDHTDPTTHQ